MDKGNNPNPFKIEEKDAAQNDFLKQMKKGMEQQEFVEKDVPHYHIANFAIFAIGTIGSLLLFVSGIALLMMRNWGRGLCILGAILLLLNATTNLIYAAGFEYPSIQRFETKQRQEGKAANNESTAAADALTVPAIYLVFGGGYAILAIAIMLSGATRRAFAAVQSARRDDDFERPPENYDAFDQRREDFDDRYRPRDYDDDR
jgi:hypothetical protein